MRKKLLFTLILIFIGGVSDAFAQADTVPDATCWKRTSNSCDGIVITEAGVHGGLNPASRTVTIPAPPDVNYPPTTYEDEKMNWDATWEFGYLRKLDAKWYAGPMVLVGFGDEGGRIGLKGRVRRYVDSRNSVEFSAGYLRGGNEGGNGGIVTDARFNVQDQISLTAGYENLDWPAPRYSPGATATKTRASAFKVGVAFGSRPAVLATGVAAGLYVALIAALLASGYD